MNPSCTEQKEVNVKREAKKVSRILGEKNPSSSHRITAVFPLSSSPSAGSMKVKEDEEEEKGTKLI